MTRPRTSTPQTLPAAPLPAADDPIWLLGYPVVRAAYELLRGDRRREERRSEVWG